ncbi:TPA: hypothetical protein I9774_000416 [Serratia marcescens]|uniref:hypothetical protein n=1 Tax=Serratia nevei TaxID=2703794 RepID=UPI001A27B0E4|nr:hypothetical protein [Serratia marcescens]
MKTFLIIITAIAAAIALPLFNEKHILDFGNTSDIISALCNCVVAGAAVYAAFQARKWFENKKFEIGHSSARDLLLTLYRMNPVLDNLKTHVEMFYLSSDTSLSISNVENEIETIEKLLSHLYSLIADCEKSIFELNGLGWKFKDKYSEIYLLPSEVDILPITLGARFSAVIYRYDFENHDESVANSAMSVKNDIDGLLPIIEQYNNAVAIILNDDLQYELYFDIRDKL